MSRVMKRILIPKLSEHFTFAPTLKFDLYKRLVFVMTVLAVLSGTIPAGSIPLEECIRVSLEKNPDIQASAFRIQSSEAMIKQMKSAYYPHLSLSGTYAQTDNPTQAFMMDLNQRKLNMRVPDFDPNNPDDTQNVRLSAGLKYRLYDGGQRKMQKEMAILGKDAANDGLSLFQNELIHQVTRGYYGFLQAQAFVEVQKESVKSLQENLRVAGERFRAGSAVKTDVLNLEVKLAQAREDLIRAENGVKLAIAALNMAIGEELVTDENMKAPSKITKHQKPEELDLEMVENRFELKAAQKMSHIKEKEYIKNKRGYVPTLNAFGSYDWDSEDLSDIEGSYIAGIMVEWELFTGLNRPNAIAGAKAEWLAKKKEEQSARNKLKMDLKQSHIQIVEAWQRMGVVQKSVDSATEALRITQEQYKRGAADITILLTAQVGLTAQKTRSVSAYYDYLTALSNFERAKGVLAKKYAVIE